MGYPAAEDATAEPAGSGEEETNRPVTRASAARDPRQTHRWAFALVAAVACVAAWAAFAATPARASEAWGWQHALRTARDLRADPPRTPLVLLLGGSCAREATVSDESWAADVGSRTGFPVATHDLGSSTQTFEQDVALAGALPKAPMIVYIALNRGRFTSGQTITTSVTPATDPKGTFTQHHYSADRTESLKVKRERVAFWMKRKYPQFKQRCVTNLAVLEQLVALCKQRGYRPVLLEMPRNTAVIGHAFDPAIREYQMGARELADRYGIPYVDLADGGPFVNTDFMDLDHLVEPGRVKFQSGLAAETARLLVLYGMRPAATPAAALSAATLAYRGRSLAAWPVGMAAIVLGGALTLRRRSARWLRPGA